MNEMQRMATEFLEKNYRKPVHTVAAALQATSGEVYLGLNIDHFSGYVCPETSALATAMNAGETGFESLVSVRKEADATIAVANPCGKCRQILHDYAPGISVAVLGDGAMEVRTIEELLPFSFMRQRQKIQEALMDETANEVVG